MAIPNLNLSTRGALSPENVGSFEPESIDQVLGKFYYQCSHGLRGPMASLEGLCNLIETDTGTYLSYPEPMRRSIEEMKVLIDGYRVYSPNASGVESLPDESQIPLERAALLDQLVFTCTNSLEKPLKALKQIIDHAKDCSENESEQSYLGMAGDNVKKIENFAADVEIFAMNRNRNLAREEVDLRLLVYEVLDKIKCEHLPDIRLSIGKTMRFATDKQRLKIILMKLVLNAICFRNKRDKAFIDIDIKASSLGVRLIVKDNGIGINEEHFGKIFSMFWRASNASAGCGLGLYMANQIANRMYGHINVKSTLGQGSEFILELPNYHYIDSIKGLIKVVSHSAHKTLEYKQYNFGQRA